MCKKIEEEISIPIDAYKISLNQIQEGIEACGEASIFLNKKVEKDGVELDIPEQRVKAIEDAIGVIKNNIWYLNNVINNI